MGRRTLLKKLVVKSCHRLVIDGQSAYTLQRVILLMSSVDEGDDFDDDDDGVITWYR